MEKKNIVIKTPTGNFNSEVTIFDENDLDELKFFYDAWTAMNQRISEYGGRKVNLPEILSEGVFCLFMDTYRVSKVYGTSSSFDAYDPRNNARIQIKGCSVVPDLTSFGPTSVWDEIYFMDFYTNGEWNGEIHIYKINNDLIYSQKVNKSQTFREQQEQGRRPRFSIYDKIIQKEKLSPIKEINLLEK